MQATRASFLGLPAARRSTAYARRGFVYDAFGRMVQSTGQLVEGEPSVVTNYRYNGLGMRIMWQSDVDADGTLEDSERTYAAYDSRWRVVATFADQAATPAEVFVHHGAGFGGSGGSSYIDSVILRDRDADADESHTLEERRYFCQNWRADVVAVTQSDGTPVEYVRYSAYGEPTVYPIADVNMDGVVDSTDYAIWVNIVAGGSPGAEVFTSDLDFDGVGNDGSGGYDNDLFLESYDANVGLSGKNHVSSPAVAGRIGYAGYEWDDVLRADHVRYRVYFPDIGRWSRRDPVGYVHGCMDLYEYVGSQPIEWLDSMGLQRHWDDPAGPSTIPPQTPGTIAPLLPDPAITRTPDEIRTEVCDLLRTYHALGLSLEDVARRYSPTWGDDQQKFHRMTITGPYGEEIDFDWLLTLLRMHYLTGGGWTDDTPLILWPWILESDPAYLYFIGKPFWMFMNTVKTHELKWLNYRRMYQQDEKEAIRYAQKLIRGDIMLEQLLAAYHCTDCSVAAEPPTRRLAPTGFPAGVPSISEPPGFFPTPESPGEPREDPWHPPMARITSIQW